MKRFGRDVCRKAGFAGFLVFSSFFAQQFRRCPAEELDPPRNIWTITLPPQCSESKKALLKVTVGPLPEGAQLRLRTVGGVLLGTVAPYGAQASRKGGVYDLPIPASAITGAHIKMVAEITTRSGPSRTPSSYELLSIEPGGDCVASGPAPR